MNERQKLRFSLRSFLVVCVAASLLLSLIISRYLAHDRWLHSIKSYTGGGGGFQGWAGSHDVVRTHRYLDRKGRPVCYALFVFDSFEPNVPACKQDYRYSSWHGGILKVDGEVVDPANGPVLFVNGAYGYPVKIHLSSDDVQTIEALWITRQKSLQPLLTYWRTEVEPRLYKLTGSSINGQRDGKWTYELWDGSLYLEAEYQLGERDGDWVSHYPDGTVQCRRKFIVGKPEGRWEYFGPDGTALGSIEWDGPYVREITPHIHHVIGGTNGWTVVVPSGKRTGFILPGREAGNFVVEGEPMQRPALRFPLQKMSN